MRSAIAMIERMRELLPSEQFRLNFLANRQEPYEMLGGLLVEEGKISAAFHVVDRSRGRTLQESLENYGRSKARDGRATERIRSLREELNWFYSRCDKAKPGEREKLQTEAESIEKKLTSLRRRSETSQKSSIRQKGSLRSIAKETRDRLGDRAFVEYTILKGSISAFIIDRNRVRHVASFASEEQVVELLRSLHFQFGALRYGPDSLAAFMPQILAKTRATLLSLHEALIAPLIEFIADKDLIIVPSGSINYVPFAALWEGSRYLVETREVSVAPSASAWVSLSRRRKRRINSFLAVGYADEQIPMAESEAESVAAIFSDSTLLIGDRADSTSFLSTAPSADGIHLACHGQFRADNPMYSSLHLANGWITVDDLCDIRLKARLVTLSACESGVSEVFAGNEILGLAKGFLTAGADSVLVSLWNVMDQTSAELLPKFYSAYVGGRSPASALAFIQKECIRDQIHPYFWAPFILIGK